MQIWAQRALVAGQWQDGLRVTVVDGHIAAPTPARAPQAGDTPVAYLLPGMANLHSHSFQRGFAGLTETRGARGQESFWTWREMMYRFALTMQPEDVYATAAMAQVEMLEAGFTRVGEFHYLHHAPDGQAYGNPAEMSARILQAATDTGIALTHLPVFYAHGGFGPVAGNAGQRRFLSDHDSFARLYGACAALPWRGQDRLGIAPHSLRAATPVDINRLTALHPTGPVHIHVAEQEKEVADCLAHCGARPVEWLLGECGVDARWCLIHATHLTPDESRAMARSGAVAGLCPVTEANLGDGIFPWAQVAEAGGAYGIGTDSNVQIGLAPELQMLEYAQRLSTRARNVCLPGAGSVGQAMYHAAGQGGARALGAVGADIAPGAPADLVALADRVEAAPAGMADHALDRWIFGRDVAVADVWAMGRHVVQGGRHVARDAVSRAFGQSLRRIMA